ncbi:MAG: SWIM zinc finger family protein [Saprospiraceae bacterium]
MQKRWLKDFEFYINPGTWNAAQDMVHDGRVRALKEVEKHFWVAFVDEPPETYEVEIMLTPHKIKAYTCECWATAGRKLMCVHVAAALLKIRHFLQKDTAVEPPVTEKKGQAAAKLSVNSILDQADPEILAKFVQDYARRDRDFALALKTWFAGQFSGADNYFLLVLDAAVPRMPMTRPLRNTELRRIRKTLDALQLQLDNAIAVGDYPLAFSICDAIMQRIPPLLGRLQEHGPVSLDDVVEYVNRRVLDWPSAQLSPELNAKRRTAVLDWYMKPGFPLSLQRPVVRFLAGHADDQAYYNSLRELFDRHNDNPAVLRLFLAALSQRNMPEAVVRVLDNSPLSPSDISLNLRVLQQTGYSEAAAHGAAHFLQHLPLSQNHRKELEDIMLVQAEKDGDRRLLTKIMQERFLEHPAPDNLARLKKVCEPDTWPDVRRQLIQALRKGDMRNALLGLLAGEHLQEALAEELADEKDLAQLQRFEDRLLPEYEPALRARYAALFDEHLKEHFGRQASVYVRNAIGSLLQRRHTGLAVAVVRDLMQRYPDRSTLGEELAELFPKNERKSLFAQATEISKP